MASRLCNTLKTNLLAQQRLALCFCGREMNENTYTLWQIASQGGSGGTEAECGHGGTTIWLSSVPEGPLGGHPIIEQLLVPMC